MEERHRTGVNDLCGCGLALTDCPIWSTVLPNGRPDDTSPDAHAETAIRRQRARVRTRHTGGCCATAWTTTNPRARRPDGPVYPGIAALTGAGVIVDTTKIPGEAALLPLHGRRRPYFVHLVRDPRAVADFVERDEEYCYRDARAHAAPPTGAGSTRFTRTARRRYPERSMLLRYEPSPPTRTDDRRAAAVRGADPADNPVHGREVRLHPNHTVTGNPDRFRTGRRSSESTTTGGRNADRPGAVSRPPALFWPTVTSRLRLQPVGTPGKGGPAGSGLEGKVALSRADRAAWAWRARRNSPARACTWPSAPAIRASSPTPRGRSRRSPAAGCTPPAWTSPTAPPSTLGRRSSRTGSAPCTSCSPAEAAPRSAARRASPWRTTGRGGRPGAAARRPSRPHRAPAPARRGLGTAAVRRLRDRELPVDRLALSGVTRAALVRFAQSLACRPDGTASP